VETENPSACATVNCNWCKEDVELYSLYLSVIMCNPTDYKSTHPNKNPSY
jgi:hypothetical protein